MPTYTDLLSEIPDWLNNEEAELTARVPGFIRAGQRRLYSDVEHRGLFVFAEGALVAGVPTLAIPTDLVRVRQFALTVAGRQIPLHRKTYGFLTEFAPDRAVLGQPKYYGLRDANTWRLARTPDQPYLYELLYKRRLADLSQQAPVNWLTENAYDALLHAGCAKAAIFLHDDTKTSQVQFHEGEYQRIVQALNIDAALEESDDYRPEAAA